MQPYVCLQIVTYMMMKYERLPFLESPNNTLLTLAASVEMAWSTEEDGHLHFTMSFPFS